MRAQNIITSTPRWHYANGATPLGMHQHLEEDSVSNELKLPRKRRERGPMTGCKCSLIFLNILTSLAAGAVIGIVIFLHLVEYTPQDVTKILKHNVYEALSYAAISSAGVFIIMSFSGYVGAIRESKLCLATFILMTLMLLFSLLITGIFGFVFRQSILDKIQTHLEFTISYKYGVDLNEGDNTFITTTVNYMQENLQCCGAVGSKNSSTSWALYKTSSKWYKQFSSGLPYVPDSCCKPTGDLQECTGYKAINGPPKLGPPFTGVMTDNSNLYVMGCFDKLKAFLEEKSLWLSALALGTVASTILTLISAIWVARELRKNSKK